MRTTLKEQAYEIIKSKILNCEYAPNSYINEGIIQQEIKVSRTPIREALNRLEQENLLKIIPKKGILISELSINDISMVYETRILIEPYIIEKYGSSVDKMGLEKFRRIFSGVDKVSDQRQATEVDDAFHLAICSVSPNDYLAQVLRSINMQNHRIRILSGYSPHRIVQSSEEHLRIIEAFDKDDFLQAALLMKEHLVIAKDVAFELLVSNGGWKTPSFR